MVLSKKLGCGIDIKRAVVWLGVKIGPGGRVRFNTNKTCS